MQMYAKSATILASAANLGMVHQTAMLHEVIFNVKHQEMPTLNG